MQGLKPRFIQNFKTQIDLLESALVELETDTICQIAQELKTTGAGYGFPEIATICSRIIEVNHGAPNLKTLEESIAELGRFYQHASKS